MVALAVIAWEVFSTLNNFVIQFCELLSHIYR